MAEFIFNCPQCKQRIQCDTSYVSSQISCPACRQTIIVPPPPMVAPGKRTIKVSTLRKAALVVGATFLMAGIIAVIYLAVGNLVLGNSTRAIWKEWSPLDGDANNWSFDGDKIHAHSAEGDALFASEKQYQDVTISATVNTPNREASLAIRMQDARNGYLIAFAPVDTPCYWNKTGFVSVIRLVSGNATTLAIYNKEKLSAIGQTAKLKVIARGPSIEVQINGEKILHVSDSTFSSGRIALRIYGEPNFPCDTTYSAVTIH